MRRTLCYPNAFGETQCTTSSGQKQERSEIACQQFNLLGSHNTRRILSVTGGDKARSRLAAALLMTYVGVPSVYYGDEDGLGTDANPSSRDCMPWEPGSWDLEMLDIYKTLIHLRRTSPALIEGGFQVISAGENTLAYLRDSDHQLVIVVGQRGPGQRPSGRLPVREGSIPDGVEFTELFSGKRAITSTGTLELAAMPPDVEIWRAQI